MFGGSHIAPWRQCNAVTPAVTATQTGAGTSNGMAMTVKVVDGAAITVTGPQYNSSFTPGAASGNAIPPAGVTLTPEYTGSRVYGAVTRTSGSALWTPLGNSFFYGNYQDTVNTAAYGMFQLGPSITPIQQCSGSGGGSTSFNTQVLPNPTTAGNTLVVCVFLQNSVTNPTVTGITLGGSAGNFTSVVVKSDNAVTFDAEIWYDPVCAGGQTSVTVSFAGGTGTSPNSNMAVYEVPAVLTADQVASNSDAVDGGTWTTGSTPVLTQVNEICFACIPATHNPVFSDKSWVVTRASTLAYAYDIIAAETAVNCSGTFGTNSTYVGVVATFYASVAPSYTVAGTPVTAGASNTGGTGGVVAAEIPAAPGMTVTEDTSGPPAVFTASATSVSTAHFTPPMGSLLVAMITAAGGTGVAVTDDNAMLAWVQLASWAAGYGYAGVWAAVVVCG